MKTSQPEILDLTGAGSRELEEHTTALYLFMMLILKWSREYALTSFHSKARRSREICRSRVGAGAVKDPAGTLNECWPGC